MELSGGGLRYLNAACGSELSAMASREAVQVSPSPAHLASSVSPATTPRIFAHNLPKFITGQGAATHFVSQKPSLHILGDNLNLIFKASLEAFSGCDHIGPVNSHMGCPEATDWGR